MAISKEKQQKLQEARTKQILDAAIELFDVKGYAETTIQDISEKAGISKGLTYRYFSSKKNILYSLVEKLNDCIEECFAMPSARDAIREFTLRLLSYPYYKDYVPPYRVFFTALIRGEVDLEELDYPIKDDFGGKYFGALFERGQRAGEFREGDAALFGDVYWKYLLGCLSVMTQGRHAKEFHPDFDAVIALFEPER